MDYPRISIVTPSFNHANLIEETILSVINQGYPNLEYIVIDGGSTDHTTDIIRKYEKHLSYWVSEKDKGLYDALNKGFSRSTGEVMGWLNSDDLLHRKSLFVIGDIFSSHKNINWLQGYPTVVDKDGRIVYHRPPRCSKYAFYLKDYHDGVFIQQESTYWRRNLWESAGKQMSNTHRFAGDFELWMRFFNYSDLYVTKALIGAFRMHGQAQISTANYDAYLKECDQVIDDIVATFSGQFLLVIEKLKQYRRLTAHLPRLTRFLSMRKFLDEHLVRANEINFDLKRQKFLLTDE